MTPLIVTLTGPSCAGKTTLETKLTELGFEAVISTTTRPQRINEKNGDDYYFVNDDVFDFMVDQGHFVEHVEFSGYRYGATRGEVERISKAGKPVVIVAEPQGRDQIAQFALSQGWNLHKVFVDGPEWLIAERFLARLVTDTACQSEKAIERVMGSARKRLTGMLTTERSWVYEAYAKEHCYDHVIERFVPETESAVINYFISLAKQHHYLQHAA